MSLKFLSAVIPLEIGHVPREELKLHCWPSHKPAAQVWLAGWGEGPGTMEGEDCHPLRHSGTSGTVWGKKC